MGQRRELSQSMHACMGSLKMIESHKASHRLARPDINIPYAIHSLGGSCSGSAGGGKASSILSVVIATPLSENVLMVILRTLVHRLPSIAT
jgi:hypothetical protein